jgi:hypothetical protein
VDGTTFWSIAPHLHGLGFSYRLGLVGGWHYILEYCPHLHSLGVSGRLGLVSGWHYILEYCPHPHGLGVSGRLVKSVAATCRHHIPKDSLDPIVLVTHLM